MVKIVSFDIGIRNLAYVYLDIEDIHNFKILDWQVIDILDNTLDTNSKQYKISCQTDGCIRPCFYNLSGTVNYCCQIHGKKLQDKEEIYCCQLMTNGNPCKSKIVKQDEEGKYYCSKHSLSDYIELKCDHGTCGKKVSFKRGDMYYCKVHSKTFFDKKSVVCQKKTKGGGICGGLVKSVNDKGEYYCEKHVGNIKRADSYDLFFLGSNLYKKLDAITIWNDCDLVLLENQPFMKNQRMKTVQIMVYSYFLMNNHTGAMNIKKIINFNARHKLDFDDAKDIEVNDKSAYKTRKKQGIEAVKKLLVGKPEHLEYLMTHKKKDDLCDSMMQAISYFDNKHN